MASVVQTKAVTGANSVTFDAATQAGNKVIVAVWDYTGATAVNGDVTDNAGNTYTVRVQNTGVAAKTAIFESQDSPTMGSAHTVSVSSSLGADRGLCAYEVSGLLTTAPFDTSANNAAGATSNLAVGPTATLAQANEVVIAVACFDVGGSLSITPAAGEGWTQAGEEENGSAFLVYNTIYKVVSATTALSANWTTGAFTDASAVIATFKAAAAGSTGSPTLGPFTSSASGTVNNPPQVAYVKEVGAVTNITAATTATMTVAAGGVPIGDVVMVLGSCDNTGTNGVATTVTVTDTRGNTWATLSPQAIADPGAAAAGIQGFIAWTRATTAMVAGDTITVTFGNSTTAKAINAQQFTNENTGTPILASSYTTQDNNVATNPSVAATATAVGQAVIALVAVEGGTADSFTQDSDTTNGTWVGLTRRGSGTTTSGATLNSAYKIVTATGAQTYNPTLGTARDNASAIVILNVNYQGSSNNTLGTFTPAASGTFTSGATTGTSARTLGSFTSSASGTVTPPPISGTAAVTLGSFTAAQPVLTPYPAAVGTDNRLIDQFGKPFMLKTMSSWGMAQRLTNSEITSALEDLKARGFNCVNFAFCGGVDSQADWDTEQYVNIANQSFFTGTPFQLGPSDSLGAGFATTDWIVSECARLGMIAMMSLFISYGATGVRAEIDAATTTHMRKFGQLVGARYNNSANVVWEIEADDGWQSFDTTGRRIDFLARGIAEGRTNYPNLWFAEAYANAPDSMGMFLNQEGTDPTGYQWLHLAANGLYWYSSDHVPAIEDARTNAVGFAARDIALWDSEPGYAQAAQYTAPSVGTAQSQVQGVRQRAYSMFIEGGSGINWGHERWWPFDLTGLFPAATPANWYDVPDSLEVIEASYTWKIVDTYCVDPTWAPTTAFVTTGEGTSTAKAAQGASNHAAVAYFQNNRTIVVDTTIISGTGNVRLRWYDPTTGTFSTIAASEAQQTGRSVTMPAARGDGTRDFLLVVDDWVEGPVAATLATFTPAASGTVSGPSTTGTVARTLGNFVPAASGTTTPPAFTGTSARTLGSFTSAATGAVGQVGTSARTLGNFTSAASGSVTAPSFTGTVASTLGPFTSTTTGQVGQVGTSARTLAPFTSTTSGTYTPPPITGSSSTTLGSFTATTTGQVGQTGSGSRTLGNFTSATTGTYTPPPITGSASPTLGSFTSTASGVFVPLGSGSGSPTLGSFVSNASGTRTIPAVTGTSASTLGNFTASATGTRTIPPVTGSGSPVLGSFASTASGSVTAPGYSGSGSPTLAPFVPTASGSVTVPGFTGTVTVVLGPATSSASGSVTTPGSSGTASPVLAIFVSTASGTCQPPPVGGSGSPTLGPVTASITGQVGQRGTTSAVLGTLVGAATGTVINPIVGTAAVTLNQFLANLTDTTGDFMFGAARPSAVYIGDTSVTAIYFADNHVWP